MQPLNAVALWVAARAFQPRPRPCFRCPFDWIGYRGRCYYFSEAEGNWTSGRDNCSALGASLAVLDSVEDLVRRHENVLCTGPVGREEKRHQPIYQLLGSLIALPAPSLEIWGEEMGEDGFLEGRSSWVYRISRQSQPMEEL